MGGPILWGPSNIASNLENAIINSDTSINKYDGIQNYILNSHAELNTTGWATYADAAQATPVDGTGGSPSVTWTQTTTSPLDGSGSFLFTKDAVNRQGQGASYAFTIDSASQAKVMTITCDYIVGSGTFVAGSSSVDSDLEVFIYDVTNSVLIQPSTYKLYSNSSTIASQFIANFQTPYNSTSYRLIFHCATTSASAYTMKFDNVKVSPTQYTYGTPITDWKAYTPTFTGFGTVSSVQFSSRRVGSNLEINGRFTPGTTTATQAQITMGYAGGNANVTADNNVIPINAIVGMGATARILPDVVNIMAVGNTNYLTLTPDNTSVSGFSPATGDKFASSVVIGFQASIPITGWSSCVQMSDSTTQQVVAASYWCSSNFAASTTVPINFDSKDFDTTGSVTTSATAWKYTAPVAGVYQVSMFTNVVGTTTANYVIYKNGSAYKSLFYSISAAPSGGCQELQLNAGDYIDIRPSTAATVIGGSLTAAGTAIITIQRISGPASIAATDTVAASYWLSAAFTASTTIPINFDSKEFDYTGSVTTSATAWKFTAPIAGLYSVSGLALSGSVATTDFILYKNGSAYKYLGTGNNASIRGQWATQLKLLAGDYIDVRPNASLSIGGGSLSTSAAAIINIAKIGNY